MAHDRTGEEIDLDDRPDELEPAHDRRCRGGWIDRDADTPVPCLVCKPHLDPAVRRRALLDADQIRATRPPEGDDR